MSESTNETPKPRGAYEPLTSDQIDHLLTRTKEWKTIEIAAETLRRLCWMAENSLLFSKEIDRLRSTPSASGQRFKPTHVHAEGGEYELVGFCKIKGEKYWQNGIAYKGSNGVLYVRDEDEFRHRFSAIDRSDSRNDRA